MINPVAAQRPSAQAVPEHPFFWAPEKRLNFLVDLSDALEHADPSALIVSSIEANAQRVIGDGWHHRLDPCLLDDASRWRK
jgi:serine/threonine-protein kinase/endoribonuclease IRE1